jgi:uncharacterized protein (DUF302 family)
MQSLAAGRIPMMSRGLLVAIAGLLGCIPTVTTADDGLVTVLSNYSAKVTVRRLEDAMRAEGWVIIVTVDSAAQAAEYGVRISPRTTIVFANMSAWIEYLIESPTIAIELAHKVLVWEDQDEVWVTRNSLNYYRRSHLARHDLRMVGATTNFYDRFTAVVGEATR